jgi:SAM-dependent methyltransferase
MSRLLPLVDGIRFPLNAAKYYRRGQSFQARHPGFPLPSRALAFDAYSAPDWDFYKKSGEETAAFLAAIASSYLPQDVPLRVLEWGCGPARVIRHMGTALKGSGHTVHGSDYNPQTIEWCIPNIPKVTFTRNGLEPPLPFEAASFDFVYSISVLTHLSESVGQMWVNELFRVMRPGAILAITTNGDCFVPRFSPDELAAYQEHGTVIRGNFEEGKKLFLAYHSTAYLKEKLFSQFEYLDHKPAAFPYTGQDLSVLRKP